MPSIISNIFDGYKQSLDHSQARFIEMSHNRQENAIEFYNLFFKNLLKNYSDFENPTKRRKLQESLQRIFGRKKITFAAIDGTNFKEKMEEYMIFFGGAYAVKGEIDHEGDPPKTRYRRWSSKEDVSVVAYVPIPYADLNDISEKQFILSPESEKFDLLNIDTKLMQLAEIFLLYNTLDNPTSRPDFVLWDQSLSGVLASNELRINKINMIGNVVMGQKITFQDAVIAFSHPHNSKLQIPQIRDVEVYDHLISELMIHDQVNVEEFSKQNNLNKSTVKSKIRNYLLTKYNDEPSIAILENDLLKLNIQWKNSWYNSVTFFKNFCQRLFNDKDSDVLIYKRYSDDGTFREHWISPTDITFLIAIGLRAVIEKAWENQVMLVGIVKDSASTYLSQKYLGTMRHVGAPGYQFDDILLPWSDRLFLQTLPRKIPEITAPWSTVEFDSVFMTMHVQKNERGVPVIAGVQGEIINKERLVMRSLAQFYLKRSGKKVNFGHVIFLDRLLMPDKEKLGDIEIKWKLSSENQRIVRPFFIQNSSTKNEIQEVMMYILKVLTRNLFPKVIGYPDPLNKADWGAVTMNRKVRKMIQSSGKFLKIQPLAKTVRDERGSRK